MKGRYLESRFTRFIRLLIKPTLVVGVTIALIVTLVLVLRSLVPYAYQMDWGLSEFTAPDDTYYRAKTLWDWLELLIVPFALAGTSLLFSVVRARAEQRLKDDEYREQALVKCFNLVTELIIKEYSTESEHNDVVSATVRAYVLATLRILDSARKGRLVLFLHAARFLGSYESDPVITLQDGDLDHSDLSKANLRGICLEGANLSRANLKYADLHGAHLEHAVLVGAKLVGADLTGASLAGANLTYADIRGADIGDDTSFEGATIEGIRASGYQKEEIRRGSIT